MSGKQHGLFWLILGVIAVLLAPALVTQQDIVVRVEAEEKALRAAFGSTDADEMISTVNFRFQGLFIDSGLAGKVMRLESKHDNPEATEKLFGNTLTSLSAQTNNYLYALVTNAWSMLLRIEIVFRWLPFILPFLAAAVVDGLIRRRIKNYTFGFYSPVSYSLALHSMIPLTAIPVLYVLVPIQLSPYFMPFWAILVAIPIMVFLANAQRLGGAR